MQDHYLFKLFEKEKIDLILKSNIDVELLQGVNLMDFDINVNMTFGCLPKFLKLTKNFPALEIQILELNVKMAKDSVNPEKKYENISWARKVTQLKISGVKNNSSAVKAFLISFFKK